MKRVRLDELPWDVWASPTGRFGGTSRLVSAALGLESIPTAQPENAHPFDLEYVSLAPGQLAWPFHSHTGQWELFLIVTGQGTVRHGDGSLRRAVTAGEAFIHPPGNAHQITNDGDTDLVYWIVANDPLTDVCVYPDSGKFAYGPDGGTFRLHHVAYWDDQPDLPIRPRPAPKPPPFGPSRFARYDDLPWRRRRSPGGRFDSSLQNISLALGGNLDVGTTGGGHPFDVQRRRIAPGAAICPYHQHAAQWEAFVFTHGHGEVRTPAGWTPVSAGDVVLHPPGSPHQTRASVDTDLTCFIVADHPSVDVCYYPDSDKYALDPIGKKFRMTEVDYFDGEE
mgnify:CR=1 FL=1